MKKNILLCLFSCLFFISGCGVVYRMPLWTVYGIADAIIYLPTKQKQYNKDSLVWEKETKRILILVEGTTTFSKFQEDCPNSNVEELVLPKCGPMWKLGKQALPRYNYFVVSIKNNTNNLRILKKQVFGIEHDDIYYDYWKKEQSINGSQKITVQRTQDSKFIILDNTGQEYRSFVLFEYLYDKNNLNFKAINFEVNGQEKIAFIVRDISDIRTLVVVDSNGQNLNYLRLN